MSIHSAGGTEFAIGPVSTATSISQFGGLTYKDVGEVESVGEFGDESSPITFTALADARTTKLKGAKDAGTMTVVAGADAADEGQEAMIAAELSTNLLYAFRVTEPDQKTTSGTGTVSYFLGKVMSKRKNVGDVSNVVRYTFQVSVDSKIYEVPAT